MTIQKFIYPDFDLLDPELDTQEKEAVTDHDQGDNSIEDDYIKLFGALENPDIQTPEPKETKVDIEKISQESYQKGYETAKSEMNELLNNKQIEQEFCQLLTEILTKINIEQNINQELCSKISLIIQSTLKHLYKSIPTNFDALFQEHFLQIIKDGAKSNPITITIHNSRKELVAQIISEHIKDNIARIKLIEDDNLNTDDIKIAYENGIFEYKIDEIAATIDKIISKNLN